MLYAISDIHGDAVGLGRVFGLLGGLEALRAGGHRLLLLGDYIDYGDHSFTVLKFVYALAVAAPDAVTALRGNHEEALLDFLDGADTWLRFDDGLRAAAGFLTEDQSAHALALAGSGKTARANAYVRSCIRDRHPALLRWLRGLPYYYETQRQIFVHAGVDEAAGDLWRFGTPEHVFTGKYPAETGRFYKDIIAGHVSARTVSGDPAHQGVYFDGESHYYIDGGGIALLCLAYDEAVGRYYELLTEDGPRGAAGTLLPL